MDVFRFGELMMTSGLVLMDNVRWISFHSGYDFGYLLKLLTCQGTCVRLGGVSLLAKGWMKSVGKGPALGRRSFMWCNAHIRPRLCFVPPTVTSYSAAAGRGLLLQPPQDLLPRLLRHQGFWTNSCSVPLLFCYCLACFAFLLFTSQLILPLLATTTTTTNSTS